MNTLTVSSLEYTDDLVAHYQALCELPGFVLLESTDTKHGRYDILSALPYDRFMLRNQKTYSEDTLLTAFQKLTPIQSDCELPFQGGAIGYFAYDLGVERYNLFRKPQHVANEMPLINLCFYDWGIVTDHRLKTVYLVAAHTQPDTARIVKEIEQYWKKPTESSLTFRLENELTPLLSKEHYQHAFHSIHHDLKRGRAYQVNYTQPFVGSYLGDTWEMYKRIRLANPVPYAAFMRYPEGSILSFSPERFLRMDNAQVLASPIKGTIKRSRNLEQDAQLAITLQRCPKNRAENTMIVDMLRNDLGRFAKTGSVHVGALCELQSFEAVHHLVSHIEAELPETLCLLEAFLTCFPGASITGAPKRESMRIISEQEPFARGTYCGSIAYFSNHNRMDSNIAIRTLIAKNESIYLSAGGGIVIDSHWKDEYHECLAKIKAIVNGLKNHF